MIHYQSTRGSRYIKTSAQAIIQGIAEDKGLYVPNEIPALPFEIEDMIGKSYQEVAFRVLRAFFEDFTDEEMQACIGHLRGQVALVKPRIILLLGATALSAVLGPDYRITRCRGKWFERKGVWILATYHPSALLRDVSKRPETFDDLLSLREKIRQTGSNI